MLLDAHIEQVTRDIDHHDWRVPHGRHPSASGGRRATPRATPRELDQLSLKWNIKRVRRVLAANEKPLHWAGSSKRDFRAFPLVVREDMGNALGVTQFGGTPPNAKPWKGLGPGVIELVESHDGNAYRAVYTVRFTEAV